MKKQKIIDKGQRAKDKGLKLDIDRLIRILLKNRGIRTKKERESFLNPKLSAVKIESLGIDRKNLKKTIERIKNAISNNEQIIIYGDYDVDGICGTAILWESLNKMGAKVLPYIPHRVDEGYGLSIRGIQNLKSQIQNIKLIITVDNGIVANEAVDFANKEGIDVIITDHHVPGKNLPEAYSFVHTAQICGAGVAWFLSREIFNPRSQILNEFHNAKYQVQSTHLELVALATVADLVPLKGVNRIFVKFGLEELRRTKRIGLLAIIKEAKIEQSQIDTYEIGHIIAPRLNAMGRLEYAMDSLRLLCTRDKKRAEDLAYKLECTNKKRQEIMIKSFEHARTKIRSQKSKIKSLIFVGHESYQQGVIGLVAGKLVEEFCRPSIVVSKGKIYSKASARSISGFNIIDFIRSAEELLIDAGGHPMAAGFTVETAKLNLLQSKLEKLAEKILTEEMFIKNLYIDCELDINYLNEELYNALQRFAPFGMGNPRPIFVSKNVVVENMKLVGVDRRHLKLDLSLANSSSKIQAIGFGMGKRSNEFRRGEKIDLVYQVEQNIWNGNSRLELKIKDLRVGN